MAFGSTLGEVLVAVGVDTKQLQTGLAKAKAETETAGTTVSKFGAVAMAGFAIAGVAAVKFGVSSVTAFMESQKVAAQTNAVLASTGEAAHLTADDVHSLALSFQNLTSFSDEAVQSAENLLLTFTQISGRIFPQTTQAVLDMSTALGQDLKSSAIQLGKALNNPITGLTSLKRVGVAFTDAQVKMITNLVETNHLLQAQKIILKEVAVEFGGSAFKEAGTLEGRLKSLGNEWNNMKESVGAAIGAVIQWSTALGDAMPANQASAETVGRLGALIEKLGNPGGSLRILKAATEDGTLSFRDFQGVLQYVKAAADGAIDPITGLTEAEQKSAEAAKKAAQAVKQWTKEAIDAFTSVKLSATALKDTFTLTAAAAVTAVSQMAKAQTRIAGDLRKLDALSIGDKLKRDLIDLGPAMVDAFVRGTPKQRAAIKSALGVFDDEFKATKERLKKLAGAGFQEVGKAADDGLIRGIALGSNAIATAAAKVVNNAITAAKRAAGVASPSKVFMEIGRDLVRGLARGIDLATPEAERAMQKLVAAMQKIVDRVKGFLDAVKGRFADFKRSISSGIASFKDLFGAISGLFGQTDENGNPIQVTGEAVAAAVQAQVAQARQLASLLRQLAKSGLSQQLLAQLAGQGAAAIPEAQALLADPALIEQMNQAYAAITHAAQTTADNLGEKFFGHALHRAKERLDELSDALHELVQAVNQTTNVTVNVQGSLMAERDLMHAIRQAAQLTGARNAFQTGFG